MAVYPPYTGPQANIGNAVALAIFAFIAIVITYLPLRSFWYHKNIPALNFVVLTAIVNLFTFLNAIIWSNDDFSSWWPGYGLCDIQVLLKYPLTVGIACSLCAMSKDLADCLDTANPRLHSTVGAKRRKVLWDILFCWAVPVHQMALHYVVQRQRYEIYPVFGCSDVLDNSWPMVMIIMIWAPLFTVLTLYYSVLLLFRLRTHRRTISKALSTTGSGMAARKYLKLVLMAFSLVFIYAPVQIVLFFLVLPTDYVPYSWSRIHDPKTWDIITFRHTNYVHRIEYRGWSGVVVAFLLWVYFGFSDDAIDTYRFVLVKIGCGHIWPSLRESRAHREEMARSRRGSAFSYTTLGSKFASHLDLVGKLMKYFDGDARKQSSGSTLFSSGYALYTSCGRLLEC